MNLVDETAADLLALICEDFGPINPLPSDLDRLALDWLQLRARSITPRPRAVTLSREVQASVAAYPAIRAIRTNLASGRDVSAWLSHSVRDRRRLNPVADMMFNDWQIMHFHLGNVFASPAAVTRTDDLLFAYVSANEATLLDIQPHRARPWTMRELLRILMITKPAALERYQLKGIVGLQNAPPTDEELYKLRRAGINVMFEIDGRFFMSPGLGLASSGHSTRIVRYFQHLRRSIISLSNNIRDRALPRSLLQELSKNVALPVRLGLRFEGGQFLLYDKSRLLGLMAMPALE